MFLLLMMVEGLVVFLEGLNFFDSFVKFGLLIIFCFLVVLVERSRFKDSGFIFFDGSFLKDLGGVFVGVSIKERKLLYFECSVLKCLV